MAKRFVVKNEDLSIKENIIEVTGTEAHHINVLRHKKGDKINVNDYLIEIAEINKDKIVGNILEKVCDKGIPNTNITLIQSYLKADKMEYVVQKAVELGVKHVIPAITKNTVVKFDEKAASKKVERLNKIAVEAIGQCGRTDDVDVVNIQNFKDIDWDLYDLILICHEKATLQIDDILEEIHSALNIAVVIGPEGGLENSEIENIPSQNVKKVVFGERILRAETASLYMLSILDYLT
ncbi:MAG: 16S rRNA (uracil(1498)-N(3))-methyltransferase [Clostridia bacterium]|nr:16S rRNA (uracil(1498)-N(3))-methyltransferase [Clostridia bacterium]